MRYLIIPEADRLDDYLSLAKQHNVAFEYNDFYQPEIYDDEARIEELIKRYKATGRNLSLDTMHGAFFGLDLASVDPVIRRRSQELMAKSCEIAQRLGVGGVVFHTGLIGGLELSYYIDNWIDEAVSFFSEQCSKYGELNIYIENTFEQTPDVFVKLMKRMSGVPNFRVCLDYAHAVLTRTEARVWLEALEPYISHIHINDNDKRNDLHFVPGCGSIDFSEWKSFMDKISYDKTVLLEIKGYDNVVAAIDFINEL